MAQRVAPAIGRTVRFISNIGLVEIFLVSVAFVFYYVSRGLVVERTAEATSRAIQVVELEQRLGIFLWETKMQAFVSSSELLAHIFNNIYVYAHFPLIGVIGLWLFFFHRERYVLLRNAFLISGGIGLIIFNLFPTAPPRLLPWPLRVQVVELEQRLGIFLWETKMQAFVSSSELLAHIFNNIYVYAHFPLIGVIGLWLFFFHRERYVLLRNAFLISGGVGLIIFNLFPTAPPRLLPWPLSDQVVDTMVSFSKVNYDIQPAAFVNRYAAMPSLHFGWNLLLGLGIIWNTKHIWARAFGVIMPASMFLAVVVTGNHFFLDVVAGTVVALGGLGIAYLIEKQGPRLWRLVLPDRVFRHLARSD